MKNKKKIKIFLVWACGSIWYLFKSVQQKQNKMGLVFLYHFFTNSKIM